MSQSSGSQPNIHVGSLAVLYSLPLVTPEVPSQGAQDHDGQVGAGPALEVAPHMPDTVLERDVLRDVLNRTKKGYGVVELPLTISILQSLVSQGWAALHYHGPGHEDYVLFEDGHGQGHLMTTSALRSALCDANGNVSMRFAFVSSLHATAIAARLAEAGVKSVVALQLGPDGHLGECAATFMRIVYDKLLAGSTVNEAFTHARDGALGAMGGDGAKAKIKPGVSPGTSPTPAAAEEPGTPNGTPTGTPHGDGYGSDDGDEGSVTALLDVSVFPPRSDWHDRSVFGAVGSGPLLDVTPPLAPNNFHRKEYIGRAGDLAPVGIGAHVSRNMDLHKLVEVSLQKRLVSIWGDSGVGKTVLVEMLAGYCLERFLYPGGVFLVDLRYCRLAQMVVRAMASAMSLCASSDKELLDECRESTCLIVVDNAPNTSWFADLMDRFILDTKVHIVASSREALNCRHTHGHRIGPTVDPHICAQLFASSAVSTMRTLSPGPVDRDVTSVMMDLPTHPVLSRANGNIHAIRVLGGVYGVLLQQDRDAKAKGTRNSTPRRSPTRPDHSRSSSLGSSSARNSPHVALNTLFDLFTSALESPSSQAQSAAQAPTSPRGTERAAKRAGSMSDDEGPVPMSELEAAVSVACNLLGSQQSPALTLLKVLLNLFPAGASESELDIVMASTFANWRQAATILVNMGLVASRCWSECHHERSDWFEGPLPGKGGRLVAYEGARVLFRRDDCICGMTLGEEAKDSTKEPLVSPSGGGSPSSPGSQSRGNDTGGARHTGTYEVMTFRARACEHFRNRFKDISMKMKNKGGKEGTLGADGEPGAYPNAGEDTGPGHTLGYVGQMAAPDGHCVFTVLEQNAMACMGLAEEWACLICTGCASAGGSIIDDLVVTGLDSSRLDIITAEAICRCSVEMGRMLTMLGRSHDAVNAFSLGCRCLHHTLSDIDGELPLLLSNAIRTENISTAPWVKELEASLRRALKAFELMNKSYGTACVCVVLAALVSNRSEKLVFSERAVGCIRPEEYPITAIDIQLQLSSLKQSIGDVDGAECAALKARDLAEQCSVPPQWLARANVQLHVIHAEMGKETFALAIITIQQCVEAMMDPDVNDKVGAALAQAALGELHLFRGDPIGAIASGEAAYSLFQSLKNRRGAVRAMLCVAKAKAMRGDYSGALLSAKPALSVCRADGDHDNAKMSKAVLVAIYCAMAKTYYGRTQYQEALKSLRKALMLDNKNGPALYASARVYAAVGDPGKWAGMVTDALKCGFIVTRAMLEHSTPLHIRQSPEFHEVVARLPVDSITVDEAVWTRTSHNSGGNEKDFLDVNVDIANLQAQSGYTPGGAHHGNGQPAGHGAGHEDSQSLRIDIPGTNEPDAGRWWRGVGLTPDGGLLDNSLGSSITQSSVESMWSPAQSYDIEYRGPAHPTPTNSIGNPPIGTTRVDSNGPMNVSSSLASSWNRPAGVAGSFHNYMESPGNPTPNTPHNLFRAFRRTSSSSRVQAAKANGSERMILSPGGNEAEDREGGRRVQGRKGRNSFDENIREDMALDVEFVTGMKEHEEQNITRHPIERQVDREVQTRFHHLCLQQKMKLFSASPGVNAVRNVLIHEVYEKALDRGIANKHSEEKWEAFIANELMDNFATLYDASSLQSAIAEASVATPTLTATNSGLMRGVGMSTPTGRQARGRVYGIAP